MMPADSLVSEQRLSLALAWPRTCIINVLLLQYLHTGVCTPQQARADFSHFTLYHILEKSLKIKLSMKQKKLTYVNFCVIYVIFDTEKLVLLLLIFENFGS